MAWVLPLLENQGQDKRVESILVPCLDAGSNPAISTKKRYIIEIQRFLYEHSSVLTPDFCLLQQLWVAAKRTSEQTVDG